MIEKYESVINNLENKLRKLTDINQDLTEKKLILES